jgi:hypothetical protein
MIRERTIGMAGGTLWLVGVSSFFAIFSLSWIGVGTRLEKGVLTTAVVAAVVALGIVIRATVAATGLPRTASQRTADDTTMRDFRRTVIAEIAGICLVNVLCGVYGRNNLMAPLDLIVVGLHFVALARVFRVPRYAVMGWLFCVLPIVTMLLVSEQTLVGRAPAWFVLPSLSCSLVVWMTAAANLREVSRMMRESWALLPSA